MILEKEDKKVSELCSRPKTITFTRFSIEMNTQRMSAKEIKGTHFYHPGLMQRSEIPNWKKRPGLDASCVLTSDLNLSCHQTLAQNYLERESEEKKVEEQSLCQFVGDAKRKEKYTW